MGALTSIAVLVAVQISIVHEVKATTLHHYVLDLKINQPAEIFTVTIHQIPCLLWYLSSFYQQTPLEFPCSRGMFKTDGGTESEAAYLACKAQDSLQRNWFPDPIQVGQERE